MVRAIGYTNQMRDAQQHNNTARHCEASDSESRLILRKSWATELTVGQDV